MESNISDFKNNVTNLSSANQSDVTQIDLFHTTQNVYRITRNDPWIVYKPLTYIIGTIIILSNLTVVISSGLILRRGQQPKSTYLLLGNVSLADTIIGITLLIGVTVENYASSNSLCIFRIGILACPAMVSIFSVGLIAVDRYIYILHGLYYQRWFTATRVRIGILCIWMIGIMLGFMPATGWIKTDFTFTRCYYVALFPGTLILINSFLSIAPILVTLILYSIILVNALKTVNVLKSRTKKVKARTAREYPKLRISRETLQNTSSTQSPNVSDKNPTLRLTKSATCINNYYENKDENVLKSNISPKSKSEPDLNVQVISLNNFENMNSQNKSRNESIASVNIIETQIQNKVKQICNVNAIAHRPKEPNKWRAITIVMLTSGSFLVTWMPFFITVIAHEFCDEQLTNPKCAHLRSLLGRPMIVLAFFNSILNPLIYAWWNKGFQKSIRNYYRIFIANHICRISK